MSSRSAIKSKELRKVDNLEEIIRLFLDIQEEKIPLMAAQKSPESILNAKARIINVDSMHRLLVEIKSMEQSFAEFSPKDFLILYSRHRSLLVETKFTYSKDSTILFPFPTEVKSMEQRNEPRHRFREGEDSRIVFNFKLPGSNLKLMEFERELFDISPGGLSIKINTSDLPLFEKGKYVNINHCPAGFSGAVAEILYVKKLRELFCQKYTYRVGLRFIGVQY